MKLVQRVAVALLLFVSPSLFAQFYYPTPSTSPVICTVCRGQYAGLPTWYFTNPPIKRFVGRYVDSQAARDYQHGTGYRTIRAKDVLVAPELNRVYIAMGETFAAYNLATFFTSTLGQPLSVIQGWAPPGEFREKYLPWDLSVYPESLEAQQAGWKANIVDGQVRLFQMDYDDRGYVYLGYSIFGWAIVKDTGTSLDLKFQKVDAGGNTDEPAIRVLSFRKNQNYYVIVTGGSLTAKVYDVTNPQAPTLVRIMPFIADSMKRSADNSVIAFVLPNGQLQLFGVDTILTPGLGTPQVIQATSGMSFGTVATDGTRFYAVEKADSGGNIVVLTPGVPGVVGTYAEARYGMAGRPQGIEFGSGYLTVWGRSLVGWGNTWLFRVQNGVPQEVNLNNYFGNYYNAPPPGYARPEGYTNNPEFSDVVVYRHAGKEYLIYSGYGLGDVYEIQTRDIVDIDVNVSAGFGTPNQNAPIIPGPFVGDLVTFSSSGTGPASILNWNFGNPESPDNTASVQRDVPVGHRYSGLTTAAAITSTKVVSAVSQADAEMNDQHNVVLKLPTPRIGLKNPNFPSLNFLFTQANASSAPVILGDELVDASDGSLEGHFSGWSYEVPATLPPWQAVPVGPCGVKPLSLTTHYTPYTFNGAVIPSGIPGYAPTAGPFSIAVRPFAPAIEIAPSGSNILFYDRTRYGTGVTPPATVQWQLMANGAPEGPPVSLAPYVIHTLPQAGLAGKKMQLIVSGGNIPAGCEAFATSIAEYELKAPDPDIAIVSGCTNLGGTCSFTVNSISGSSQADWTYQWFIDGQGPLAETGRTVAEAKNYFGTAGAHTISVSVNNSIGIPVPASEQVTLAAPTCDGVPIVTITWTAASGCANGGTACAVGEAITFSPRVWIGRQLQFCDELRWTFGTGASSTDREPVYTYQADGIYPVTLTINNGNPINAQIQVGSGTPPPPPPPPPPPCPDKKPANILLKITGSHPSCNENDLRCNRNDTINFAAQAFFLYTFQTCDIIEWKFGDGATSYGQYASHKFEGAEPSYTVTLTVRNTLGEYVVSKTIQMEGTAVAPPTEVDFTTSVPAGVINQPVRFTATATSADPNTLYKWNFGDFGTAEGRIVEHAFATAKTYNVTLTVTNSGGSAISSKLFEVGDSTHFGYLLPAVAHISRPDGTRWQTDLHIYDPNYSPTNKLNLTTEFEGETKNLEVTSSTYILEDFMRFFTSSDDAGAVTLRGNAARVPQVWIRTYIVAANGVGTYGQLIPAIPINGSQNLETESTTLILAGLRETTRYRTNVGLTNISANGVDAIIRAYDSQAGVQIGGDVVVSVGPYQLAQINMRDKIPSLPDQPFSIRISADPPGAILGYASMIDNVSQDPVFISAMPQNHQSAEHLRVQLLPGVAHFGLWRTDATIFNANAEGITFRLTYISTNGNVLAGPMDFAIPANAFLQLDDIAGIAVPGDSIGHLHVETLSAGVDYPVVYGRTYNDRMGDGTFGQGIPAFAPASANVIPGRPAYIAGVRGDSYRTNVGLVAAGTVETVVRISLLDDESGAVLVTRDHTLQPNQSLTQPVIGLNDDNFMHKLATRGSVKIEILSGAAVWAYASIIDKVTGDPEYVPAVPLN